MQHKRKDYRPNHKHFLTLYYTYNCPHPRTKDTSNIPNDFRIRGTPLYDEPIYNVYECVESISYTLKLGLYVRTSAVFG